MRPQRYAAVPLNAAIAPSPAGDLVLFADIEPALRDSERLAWVRPIVDGSDDAVANRRTAALAGGLLAGLTGDDLVDHAMRVAP